MEKSRELRKLFSGNKIIRIMGAHNALSAKIAQEAGFDGIWASGLEISTSYGVPDANILTMTDFLNAAISMNEATDIPVIADCDTGFGNSNNVIHMVNKYESAGIAAVCIEDKLFPKVNSFIPGRQELAPISEFVGKILAAKNAQQGRDFMVIARVEALIAGWGMDEALKRANAYVEAGADAILIHSKSKKDDEIREFARKWKNRSALVVVPTTYNKVTAAELEKMKIKMVIYANQNIRACVSAMEDVCSQIYRDGSSASIEDRISPMDKIFELQGMNKMKESELFFSKASSAGVTAVIPAAGDHLQEYSMKNISSDIPIAMLDINGKPLLLRQAEELNKSKVYDIKVVGGYKREKISVNGVSIVDNDNYAQTGIMYSIMRVLKDLDNPALIVYGDVLFDHVLIDRLLHSNKDITIVLDNSVVREKLGRKKNIELARVALGASNGSKRCLRRDDLFRVEKIGSSVNAEGQIFEFAGIAYISKSGLYGIKKIYKKAERSKKSLKISLADFLQQAIESGIKINALVVNSGWLEINSLQDYKFACSVVK